MMCGRYTLYVDGEELSEAFQLSEPLDWEPRYNITPGEQIPAMGLREEDNSLGGTRFRWGLIPRWVDDRDEFSANLINARSETVASKPAFRDSFRKRRCLIPTTGFYEWTETEEGKQPWFFFREDEQPFALAGIWDRWVSDGETVESCAILTTEANEDVEEIHHRMPVVIPRERFRSWLQPGEPSDMLETMVEDAGVSLRSHAVDDRVNRPDVDDPDCVKPVSELTSHDTDSDS